MTKAQVSFTSKKWLLFKKFENTLALNPVLSHFDWLMQRYFKIHYFSLLLSLH